MNPSALQLPDPSALHPATAVAIAIAGVVGSLVVGFGLVRLAVGHLRRLTGFRGPWLVTTALAWSGGVATLALASPVPLWDAATVALALLVGGLRGFVPRAPDNLTRVDLPAVAGLVLSLGLAEAATRRWLPVPPTFPPLGVAALTRHEGMGRDVRQCAVLFPAQHPEAVQARAPSAAKASLPVVLHLGDSMLQWVGVPPAESTVGLLDRADPERVHVTTASSLTGPTFHWLAARHWTPLLHPRLVVLHLGGEGDLSDHHLRYSCCDCQPLVAWRDGRLVERCPEPSTRCEAPGRLEDALATSPPPLVARLLTPVSWLARWTCTAAVSYGLDRRNGDVGGPDEEVLRAALQALRDELAAAGVPLMLVLNANRRLVESLGSDPLAVREWQRWNERLSTLGVPVLDENPTLLEAARRGGARRLFSDASPDDIHLGREGHALVAHWLLGQLRAADEARQP